MGQCGMLESQYTAYAFLGHTVPWRLINSFSYSLSDAKWNPSLLLLLFFARIFADHSSSNKLWTPHTLWRTWISTSPPAFSPQDKMANKIDPSWGARNPDPQGVNLLTFAVSPPEMFPSLFPFEWCATHVSTTISYGDIGCQSSEVCILNHLTCIKCNVKIPVFLFTWS